MSLSLMFYFLLASIMVAALPGPAMMLTIQSAVVGGWQQGIKVTAGILLADVVLLLLVCIGLGEIIGRIAAAGGGVEYSGGALSALFGAAHVGGCAPFFRRLES